MRDSKERNGWLALGAAGAMIALAALGWFARGSSGEPAVARSDPGETLPSETLETAALATVAEQEPARPESERRPQPGSSERSSAGTAARRNTIHVRAVDADGRGIPGVFVGYGRPGIELEEVGPLRLGWSIASDPSDGEGRAVLEVADGRWVVVAGRPPIWGYAASESFVMEDGASREVKLRLKPLDRTKFVSGVVLEISAGHPTADGRTFGDLRAGAELDGQPIERVEMVPYRHSHTYDILPASDSRAYFAGGALIGSTLGP